MTTHMEHFLIRFLMLVFGAYGMCISCTDDSSSSHNGIPVNDADSDGVADERDNCPEVKNPAQGDANQNGFGDACETRAFAPEFTVLKADTANITSGHTLFSVVGGENVFLDPAWQEFGFLATLPLLPSTAESPTIAPDWVFADFNGAEFNIVDVLSNGHILAIRGADGGKTMVEIDPVTAMTVRQFTDREYSHDVMVLPDGNYLAIWAETIPYPESIPETLQFEHVGVVDAEGNTLWDWNLYEQVPDAPASEQYVTLAGLWSNCNAVDFKPADDWQSGTPLRGNVYLNARVQNRLYNISYPSGDILWIMGDDGDFGENLFHHPHDAQIVADPGANSLPGVTRILLYDNREAPVLGNATACPADETCPLGIEAYSRLLEIEVDETARTARIVWKWPSPTSPDFSEYALYSPIAGGIDQLPDGHLLITHATVGGNPFLPGVVPHGRLMEIQRDGTLTGATVLWDVVFSESYGTFKAIRLPEGSTDSWTSLPLAVGNTPPSD